MFRNKLIFMMIATLVVFTTSSSVVADEKVIKWKL
ncbi:uncharacterized protein METZ01_LOCUS491130, partial [marine metagenome]